MAVSCPILTVRNVASLVGCGSIRSIGCGQIADHGLAKISMSGACSFKEKFSSSARISSFHLDSTATRKSGIVARAVELEETAEDGILFSSEALSENEPAATSTPGETKLYIGNLPWSVNSKQLAEICQDCGNVELVEVIYDRDTQRSRGFAFVTMRTEEDAARAIATLNGYEIEGRALKVNFPQMGKSDGARPLRNDRPPRRDSAGDNDKVYVGNLSWGVDDVALAELFTEYGQVVEAKVVYDRETGRSRGFGFVTMSSTTEVDMAIQALDGAEFDGRILRLNRAGDKPDRRAAPRREY